ncbi:hypothetical protein AB6A40_002231 [Gnathostoma spinigerum]|uniref:TIL domain-containing protein n=1 Tax=Gnathostoma spinigerum TaxID=75299 RepID=A0ABD6E8A0_9BILA
MKRLSLIFLPISMNLLSSMTHALTFEDIKAMLGPAAEEEVVGDCKNSCGENEVCVKKKKCLESCDYGWRLVVAELSSEDDEDYHETDCVKQPGCQCRRGYFRNDNGTCVDIFQCPRPECPNDAEWSDNKAHCGPTCYDLKARICIPSPVPVPGCRCKKDYAMKADGKGCMLASNCTAEIAEKQLKSDLEDSDLALHLPKEVDFLGDVRNRTDLIPPGDVKASKI